MHPRDGRLLAAAALLLAAAGCGGTGLVDARGRLTYKGQPVPSTYVIFQSEDSRQRASRGLTDDQGNFSLAYSQSEKGVVPGRHTVFLQYHVSSAEELHEVVPKASRDLRAVIEKYGEPEKSPLHYEVTRGRQFFNIEIE